MQRGRVDSEELMHTMLGFNIKALRGWRLSATLRTHASPRAPHECRL